MPEPTEEVLEKSRQALTARFPNLKEAVNKQFDDFAKIHWLLSDYTRLKTSLKNLDAQMAAAHGQRGGTLVQAKLERMTRLKELVIKKSKDLRLDLVAEDSDLSDWTLEKPIQELVRENRKKGKEGKAERVLTHLLATSERHAGMNAVLAQANQSPAAGLAARLFLKLIEPETFGRELGGGASWKDVGAGPGHGEYTHRIQWYCLYDNFKWNTQPLFATLGTLYGQQSAGATLWDFLFDQTRVDVESDADCRCPEHFNDKLCKDEGIPVLSAWLRATREKRMLQGFPDAGEDDDASETAVGAYWAEKRSKLNETNRMDTQRVNGLK